MAFNRPRLSLICVVNLPRLHQNYSVCVCVCGRGRGRGRVCARACIDVQINVQNNFILVIHEEQVIYILIITRMCMLQIF